MEGKSHYLELDRLSPKSLKDLLLSEYRKPDVLRALLAELTRRNDLEFAESVHASDARRSDPTTICGRCAAGVSCTTHPAI